jgi:hypothetical protein
LTYISPTLEYLSVEWDDYAGDNSTFGSLQGFERLYMLSAGFKGLVLTTIGIQPHPQLLALLNFAAGKVITFASRDDWASRY